MSEPAGAAVNDVPPMKPDGWHTYHICGGQLRELTWSGLDALCVVCGVWFRAVLEGPHMYPDVGLLREALDETLDAS